MKNIILISFIAAFYVSQSCSEEVSSKVNGGWLIPESQVFNGGPGKDGIPAIDNPNMISISEVNFME